MRAGADRDWLGHHYTQKNNCFYNKRKATGCEIWECDLDYSGAPCIERVKHAIVRDIERDAAHMA